MSGLFQGVISVDIGKMIRSHRFHSRRMYVDCNITTRARGFRLHYRLGHWEVSSLGACASAHCRSSAIALAQVSVTGYTVLLKGGDDEVC